MLSFQEMYEMAQAMASDEDSTVLTFLKQQINLGVQDIQTELNIFYTEETYTDSTVANQQAYQTPDNFIRFKQIYILKDGNRYYLREVYTEEEWTQLNLDNTFRADIPQFFIARRDTFELYPVPSTSSYSIVERYESGLKELSRDNYTTGTISALTNGQKAVTGNNTDFSSDMVGRYIKLQSYPLWYKIAAYTSPTAITLQKPFQGTTISSDTQFVIGELPELPATAHVLPVYYALMNYFGGIKKDPTFGPHYKQLYDTGLKRVKTTYSKRTASNYIESRPMRIINPNDYKLIT